LRRATLVDDGVTAALQHSRNRRFLATARASRLPWEDPRVGCLGWQDREP